MTEKETPELKEDYSQFSYQWIKGDLLSKVQHYQDIVEEGDRKYESIRAFGLGKIKSYIQL